MCLEKTPQNTTKESKLALLAHVSIHTAKFDLASDILPKVNG